MAKAKSTPSSEGQFLVYQTEDGRLKVDVRFEGESVWLTQPMMAELFQTSQQNISKHILSIFEDGELTYEATHNQKLLVRQEGKREVRRPVEYYNLRDRELLAKSGYEG